MTYTDVWIGNLAEGKDPLDWGGEWGIGNLPSKALCPRFPPSGGTYEPFRTVVELINSGALEGRQVDWGAWAAVVTKHGIMSLIDKLYGPDNAYCELQHLCEALVRLRTAVQLLPADGRFALVADEF